MEPIHMARWTARGDREHVHTEKTWSENEMEVKEMSKTAMKRVNPRKRDWEDVYTDCQRNNDGSENFHW